MLEIIYISYKYSKRQICSQRLLHYYKVFECTAFVCLTDNRSGIDFQAMIIQFLKGATTWFIWDFIWFRAFQFDRSRGKPKGRKTFINVWTALRLHFLSNGSLKYKAKMVLKTLTKHFEVSFPLSCSFAALNIPFGFHSRKDGLK